MSRLARAFLPRNAQDQQAAMPPLRPRHTLFLFDPLSSEDASSNTGFASGSSSQNFPTSSTSSSSSLSFSRSPNLLVDFDEEEEREEESEISSALISWEEDEGQREDVASSPSSQTTPTKTSSYPVEDLLAATPMPSRPTFSSTAFRVPLPPSPDIRFPSLAPLSDLTLNTSILPSSGPSSQYNNAAEVSSLFDESFSALPDSSFLDASFLAPGRPSVKVTPSEEALVQASNRTIQLDDCPEESFIQETPRPTTRFSFYPTSSYPSNSPNSPSSDFSPTVKVIPSQETSPQEFDRTIQLSNFPEKSFEESFIQETPRPQTRFSCYPTSSYPPNSPDSPSSDYLFNSLAGRMGRGVEDADQTLILDSGFGYADETLLLDGGNGDLEDLLKDMKMPRLRGSEWQDETFAFDSPEKRPAPSPKVAGGGRSVQEDADRSHTAFGLTELSVATISRPSSSSSQLSLQRHPPSISKPSSSSHSSQISTTPPAKASGVKRPSPHQRSSSLASALEPPSSPAPSSEQRGHGRSRSIVPPSASTTSASSSSRSKAPFQPSSQTQFDANATPMHQSSNKPPLPPNSTHTSYPPFVETSSLTSAALPSDLKPSSTLQPISSSRFSTQPSGSFKPTALLPPSSSNPRAPTLPGPPKPSSRGLLIRTGVPRPTPHIRPPSSSTSSTTSIPRTASAEPQTLESLRAKLASLKQKNTSAGDGDPRTGRKL